ncbi:MAG: phage tail tape measure protein, partial [Rudaea sp.]|nr:phage tail tape measure protein [Rudaea sp.]
MAGIDQELRLRISGDGSGLSATLRSGTDELRTFKSGIDSVGAAGKAAGEQTAAGFDKMGASAAAFMSQTRNVQSMLGSEAKSLADVAARREAYASALKNGLISQAEFTTGSKALNSQQAALEKQLGKTAKGANGAAGAVSHLGIQSAGAQREIGVLIGELARGNFAAFEKSLITLARQTGLLTTGFQLLLGPIGLIAGIAAIAIAAFVSLEVEQSRLNKAIISTGNYAGVTVAQVQQLGTTVGAQTGKISETRQALDLLVASGKFTGSQLALVGKGVVDFATVTGTSVEKAVDTFKKLADDPVKASIALNDQYHFLTLSIYDQIAAAEKNGDTQQAAAIAEKALAEEFGRRAKTMEDNLGTVERAWKGVTSAAKGAWDAILDIGRTKSPDEQLKAARSKVNEASNFLEEILAGKIGYAPDSFINARKADLQSAIDAEAKLYASLHKTGQAAEDQSAALAGIHQQEQDAAIKARADFDKLNATFDKTAAAQEKINKAAADLYKIYIGGGKLPEGVRFDGPVADVPVGPGWDKLKTKILEASGAFKGVAADERRAEEALGTLNQTIDDGVAVADKLANGYKGQLGQALNAYDAQIDKLGLAMDSLEAKKALGLISNEKYAALFKKISDAAADAGQQLQETTAHIEKQADVVGSFLQKVEDDKALASLTDREYAVNKALNEQIDKWDRVADAQIKAKLTLEGLNPHTEEGARKVRDAAAAAYDYTRAMDYMRQGAQEVEHTIAGGFSNAFSAVGQLLTGQIRSFKDFWGSVVSGFKNMFAQIIASSLQMRMLGPIMQSFGFNGANYGYLGGGASLLGSTPALVQTGSALAASGAIPGGGAYTLGNVGGNGLQGLGDLFSPTQWFGLGKSLFSGFSSLWGGSAFNPASANFVGPPVAGQTFGPQFGGYSSAFQQILGALGGAYAGINRAQNADGAFGKIGGGLSYGLGTYALGAGLSSLAAGTGFAAGVSGAFSAIPVAGWVALGAMVLDKISGGNLFGTGWNPTGNSRSNLSVTAAGASFQNEYEEKKKKALFGGNTYTWVGTDTTDEQKQWLDQFTAAMKQVRESASAVLGNTIADTVTGAFSQKFDKDGKVTEQISTVLGKTYKESIDAFAKRMQAENVFAQIDAALGTKEASGIAEQYRKNADQLSEAAKMLLQAQVDVKHGMSLLGESTSLTQINAVVSQLAASGETLIDAYTRLQSETQTFRSALDIIGVSIDKTGADFVRFADAAATAAGGVDKFKTLLDGFQSAFYSASELAKAQAAAYRKQSDGALTGLGLDPSISLSDFRAKFEAALPKLTPEQLATWLNAANFLAQATSAEKAYSDQLKQNAETIRSVLVSLNPAGDPLAGTWTQTLANINATFDQAIEKLKAAGATVDQLALAEAYRPEAIAKAQKAAQDNYANLVSQIRKGIDELNTPATDLQKALDGIAQAEKDTIDQLNAAARAANMQSASEADLAAAHLYAAMQADAARKAAAEAQKKAYQDYASVAA